MGPIKKECFLSYCQSYVSFQEIKARDFSNYVTIDHICLFEVSELRKRLKFKRLHLTSKFTLVTHIVFNTHLQG